MAAGSCSCVNREIRHPPFIPNALASAGPIRGRKLARRVGRNVSAVHSDAQRLSLTGLIDKTDSGKLHFPYDVLTSTLVGAQRPDQGRARSSARFRHRPEPEFDQNPGLALANALALEHTASAYTSPTALTAMIFNVATGILLGFGALARQSSAY